MAKQYRSELLASVHETADGLHQAGLMPKRTIIELSSRSSFFCVARSGSPARADFARDGVRRTWACRFAPSRGPRKTPLLRLLG